MKDTLLTIATLGGMAGVIAFVLWWLSVAPAGDSVVPYLFAALVIFMQDRANARLQRRIDDLTRANMALSNSPPAQQVAVYETAEKTSNATPPRQDQPPMHRRQGNAPLHS